MPEAATLLERAQSNNPSDWPTFSHSQVSTFDHCEQQWSYVYLDKIVPKRENESLNVGTIIHEGLDVYYGNGKSKKFLMDWMDLFLEDLQDDSLLPETSRAFVPLWNYVNNFAPEADQGHEIISTEVHLVVHFVTPMGRNVYIQAYVDLLTKFNHRFYVWDHKTGLSPFWSDTELWMDSQTPLYSALLREQGYDIEGIVINQFYTYPYKKPIHEVPMDKLFKRSFTSRTPKQLNYVLRNMLERIDRLLDVSAGRPIRSLDRRKCKSCAYNKLCLSVTQGLPVGNTIKAEFKERTHR